MKTTKLVLAIILISALLYAALPAVSAFTAEGEFVLPETVLDAAVAATYLEEFPDANFRREVLALLNVDGGNRTDSSVMTAGDINKLAEFLDLVVASMGIKDMTGLGYFAGLRILDCSGNQLTGLDISDNTTLWTLNCSYNHLSKLDVSSSVTLGEIICTNNQMIELSLPKYNNNFLIWMGLYLDCSNNLLTELDVTDIRLFLLNCSNNQLTELDVLDSGLWYLDCSNNLLTELDISDVGEVFSYLDCHDNYIASPDDVDGWQEYKLDINSPDDLEYGTFRFYNQKTPAATPTVSVSSAEGKAGKDVTLSVSLKNNPGLANLGLGISYDASALKLESATSAWNGMIYIPPQNPASNPYNVLWSSSTFLNNNSNGVILNLHFTVLTSAADGVYPIKLTYDPLSTIDENNKPIEPVLADGCITVNAAQTTFTFTGAILYQPSPISATISLYLSGSKTGPIATATTTDNGSYSLSVLITQQEEGKLYTLKITKPGYLSYTITNLTLEDLLGIGTRDIRQLAGDVNGDGIVNAVDLTFLLSEFNRAPSQYRNADIDGNGIVNAADLTYLLAGFNRRNVVEIRN